MLALMSLLMGTPFVVPTPATATTPGKNGQIAFTRYRQQDNPIWSEIFVANADGSHAYRVSHSSVAVEDDQAHWSPDGRWIVFDRCSPDALCSVWLVRADGHGQRRLSPACPLHATPATCGDDGNPSFAPDGQHVVFTRSSGRIRHDPLGDQIERSTIVLSDLSGKHTSVLRQIAGFRGDLQAGRLSPDGKKLLIERYNSSLANPEGGRALFVSELSRKSLRRLTPWALNASGADWSPDSMQVLFSSSQSGDELVAGSNLFTVQADGSSLKQLTHVPETKFVISGSYSPDGRSIVFATNLHGTPNPTGPTAADVFVMRIGNTAIEPVTRTPNLDGWPAWGA